MSRPGTLVERLIDGEAGALHQLSNRDPCQVEQVASRAVLARGARDAAAALADRKVGVGDRVVLSLPNGVGFAQWFLGALHLGAVPVPMPEVRRGARREAVEARFAKVLADCAPRVVVAPLELGQTLGLSTSVLAAPEPPQGLPAPPRAQETPERLAFIQYTAGSTGAPKGVAIGFDNLRANLEQIAAAVALKPQSDRVLSWLPLFHDMGLVGTLLFSLYWDLPLYLYSPLGFALRPAAWLRAISHHRATLSPAPHFAYGLCASQVLDEALRGVDLSCWRVALDGSEPVQAHSARGFIARFSRFGFSAGAYLPVYGLAEATLAATCPPPGRGPRVERLSRASLGKGFARPALEDADAVELVSVGCALKDSRVTIRDGEALCPENTVGEICLEGPSLSRGEYPLARQRQGALRTGDLGFLSGGELFVVDRVKDLIIVAGANLYPSDIEEAVGQVAGVRRGGAIAFGVPRSDGTTEDLVIAIEHRKAGPADALVEEIHRRVVDTFGVSPQQVLLVDPERYPSTPTGKRMRRKAREDFLSGVLTLRRKPAGA